MEGRRFGKQHAPPLERDVDGRRLDDAFELGGDYFRQGWARHGADVRAQDATRSDNDDERRRFTLYFRRSDWKTEDSNGGLLVIRGRRKQQSGFLMLEVMIAVVVLALGLLGLAGLQAR